MQAQRPLQRPASVSKPIPHFFIFTVRGSTAADFLSAARPYLPARFNLKAIRSRVLVNRQRPASTVYHMTQAVRAVEMWYWEVHNDERPVESLPTHVLDRYLSEFFEVFRKDDGNYHDTRYVFNFRSSLSRFLKDNNYPACITKDEDFRRSRAAFTRNLKKCHPIHEPVD